MPDLVITSVRIVEWIDKHDAPSNEVFAVGEAMRFSSTGAVTPANGTTTTEANFQGIATIESDRIGKTINVVRDGILDVGEALAGLAPGDAIYLSDTDGTLATTAGTVSVVVGRVEPGNANGTTADLLLRVRKGA
jgi:hypothetical protein